MRLLFVLPRMVSGGVERVTLNLIRQFAADGVECMLALRRAHGEFLDEARSLVPVVELAPSWLFQFVPALSNLIRSWRPSRVITAFPDVAFLTWFAMRMSGSDARLVHGVHNTHAELVAREGMLGWMRYKTEIRICGFLYRHADAIVAVSDGVRVEVLERFSAEPARVMTIHNPIISQTYLREVAEPRHALSQPYRIIAIGRLAKQKGFDVLIEAMAKVPGYWQLDIWGEGPERGRLESLIAENRLNHVVRLRGHTDEPLKLLRKSDLYVLSSRHEGLPTVLVEALACQCQIVATDCQHGPREILQGGMLGQLVAIEDANGLAMAISNALCGNARVEPRLLLLRAGDFTMDVAYRKWRALLH